MNRHTVFVAGKRFVLLSDDSEEYVKKLAGGVSEAINKISEENPTLDRRASALLCALNYADDREKEKLRNKSLSDKAKPLIVQADKQSRQIRELKEQLAKKDGEIKRLNEINEKLKSDLKNKNNLNPPKSDAPVEKKQSFSDNGQGGNKNQKGYQPKRQFSLFENE